MVWGDLHLNGKVAADITPLETTFGNAASPLYVHLFS